jgi:hypothetical protein
MAIIPLTTQAILKLIAKSDLWVSDSRSHYNGVAMYWSYVNVNWDTKLLMVLAYRYPILH